MEMNRSKASRTRKAAEKPKACTLGTMRATKKICKFCLKIRSENLRLEKTQTAFLFVPSRLRVRNLPSQAKLRFDSVTNRRRDAFAPLKKSHRRAYILNHDL